MFQFERNLKNKRFVALIDEEMVMMVVVVVMMILSLSVLEKKNLSVSLAINASEGVLRFYVRHPKTFVWGRRGKKLRKRKKQQQRKFRVCNMRLSSDICLSGFIDSWISKRDPIRSQRFDHHWTV